MSEQEKIYMTWQDKLAAVSQIMQCLEGVDVKDGDKEQELVDIMQIALRLLLPFANVGLKVSYAFD